MFSTSSFGLSSMSSSIVPLLVPLRCLTAPSDPCDDLFCTNLSVKILSFSMRCSTLQHISTAELEVQCQQQVLQTWSSSRDCQFYNYPRFATIATGLHLTLIWDLYA